MWAIISKKLVCDVKEREKKAEKNRGQRGLTEAICVYSFFF